MTDADLYFIAYALNKGKTNLTAAEQAHLADLGSRHLKSGDAVVVDLRSLGAEGQTSKASVVAVDGDQVKVQLTAPVSTFLGSGVAVEAVNVTVPRFAVTRAPDPTATAAAAVV